jgi:hypothetical protein
MQRRIADPKAAQHHRQIRQPLYELRRGVHASASAATAPTSPIVGRVVIPGWISVRRPNVSVTTTDSTVETVPSSRSTGISCCGEPARRAQQ